MNSSEVSAETLALYQKYHEESRRNAALKADNAKVILLKEYEEISNFISDIENKRDEVERHCTLSLNADRSDKKNIIIPSNPYLDSLIQTVTDHICKLLNCYRDLKIWIQYHVPALTDGADFRIPVIEDVLSMITNVEGSSSGFLSNGIDYHLKRAGIVKILRSFPQHEDAKAALSHHDNKSFTDVYVSSCSIRDDLSQVIDILTKNENIITSQ
ncbi:putative Proteasome activator pa28 beta subunit [Blattamonas nauphoetae]|uniref:Proteasome activator pa28 beta subunit n=1 Tax=Blattamonas nauphoetae TaxID=2049346 RepID=A0ABQ9YA52_9EUKA|nr:putative Proteasome activator pa28 beta subunit [Blattamonas nauphoetae]